jgi:hypothetical protein
MDRRVQAVGTDALGLHPRDHGQHAGPPECSGNAETDTDNDASSDSGEPTGMREDVEDVLDRAASSDQADPVAGGDDAFARLFDYDEGVGSSELELARVPKH